jgi:hypothetical protein
MTKKIGDRAARSNIRKKTGYEYRGVLCRRFGFKLLRDGNDDGIEFSQPRTYQSDHMLTALVDDGVE